MKEDHNIYRVIKTLLEIRTIIKKEEIKISLSTGSYIAPIASLLSFTFRIKYYGQEQNIYAGLGNKVTSFLPGVIFTSYPETKNIKKKKTIYVGPIINKDIVKINKTNNAEFLTIGVQGGSQGSEQINSYLYKFLNENNTIKVNFLHITGKDKLDNNSRLLGLDLGSKRIGVSVCDDRRKIATPYRTIQYTNIENLSYELSNIINENNYLECKFS